MTSDHDRAHWQALWATTVWELLEHGQWMPLPAISAHPVVVISAWNPRGLRLPPAVNQARDAVLLAELRALGWSPQRARGRCPTGRWHEDGWLIPHTPLCTSALLGRYGQIAGLVTDAVETRYHWSTSSPACCPGQMKTC